MSEQTVQERNNPYLEGSFAPITEEVTATDL
jgi:carotenoid cleavage dioxygenase-like enzyme